MSVRRPLSVTPRGVAAEAGALASSRVRERMVERVRDQGVSDARVLEALRQVPRHIFVDDALASRAYEDTALPIGFGQTISQPYIVARSVQLALQTIVDPAQAIALEIGTGCGYAAAVLAHIFGQVISIERIRALHERARDNLRSLRLPNLRLVFGDGALGVPSAAPFDAIIAAAAGEDVPPAWIVQLKLGGRVIAPVGSNEQFLAVLGKDANGQVSRKDKEPVRFVPLRGGVA